MIQSIFINRLNKIRELNSKVKGFVNKDLYKLLCKEQALIAGYENIKSKKADITPGGSLFPCYTSTQDLSKKGHKQDDGWSLFRLKKLQSALKNESWIPLPAISTRISPISRFSTSVACVFSTEKRILGIQGLEEKVVQSVLALILDALYEPSFSHNSFGFRRSSKKEHGVHDALKVISQKYDGMRFAIQTDIKGIFDNANHHRLIELLKKRIKDDRLIRLFWKLLRAGYMDSGISVNTRLDLLQGSTVLHCLASIYLNQLDELMERICKSAERYSNPKIQIVYTRYSNDFIVGIAGSKTLAYKIQEQILYFLKILSLKVDKSKIYDLKKENAFFLGHEIRLATSIKSNTMRGVSLEARSRSVHRYNHKSVKITAPLSRIIPRLHEKGFCDRKGFPTSKSIWKTKQDDQIIALFNAASRTFFEFYSGVQNKQNLSRIKYIFKFSCATTLAAKHRCSLAQILKKHGATLKVRYGKSGEKEISLYQPDLKNQSRVWQTGKDFVDPYRHTADNLIKSNIYSCKILAS